MNAIVKSAIAVSLLALMSSAVTAQTVKNGGISGIIVSRSASIPASSSVDLYTTPATGFFIITQFCSNSSSPLVGSGIGEIVRTNGDCKTFTPGIVVPAGTALSCSNGEAYTTNCFFTGVLSKK